MGFSPLAPATQAPPGEVVGYDLQFDPDPHCPGWVPVPRFELELPEGGADDTAQADLPAGHGMTLPPPPTAEEAAVEPPTVKETLRPVEVGR